MNGLGTALRMARRELRGGLSGFRIFLACLALGVAAIAAIGSLSSAVQEGLRADARKILGGDASFRMIHRPAEAEAVARLRRSGTVSTVTELRTMAYQESAAAGGPDRLLVEVKAVDDLYPLYGEIALGNDGELHALLGERGALVDPLLLERLDMEVGQSLRIGEIDVTIRGVIAREPDRGTGIISLGPRLMVSQETLAATGLVRRGSLVFYRYRVRLPPGTNLDSWLSEIGNATSDAGWRVRSAARPAPGLDRFIDQITLYLTLVGLTALLIGGLGVAGAVRAYLDSKTATIATMKCVGAPARQVFQTYFIQILILAALGILIGLVVGAATPLALAPLVEDLLKVTLQVDIYWLPLLVAAIFGLLTAIAFSLWALAQAREVPPGALFRQVVSAPDARPRPFYQALTGIVALMLAALAILTAEDRVIAAIFIGGAVAAFILFRGAAWLIAAIARHLTARGVSSPTLRLALANMHRPGAAAPSVVLSLGLGVTVLVAVALIQGNIIREVGRQLPDQAPSYFFIDIQPQQVETFDRVLREADGVTSVERVPMVRGRIVELNGVPAEQANIDRDVRWAVRSERGLTYAARKPENSSVVAGEWWPPDYSGPPLVSFDAELARGMGLTVGDTITFNVLGRDIAARIGNLRRIEWRTMGVNFTVIFAPGTLENAPHTQIAAVHAERAAEPALLRAVTDRLPNVTAIRVRDALSSFSDVLNKIAATVQSVALITILAGTLVLAGAIAAGHRRRVYNAVVLKVLGATRARVTRTFLLEYGLLGLATAAVAAVIGSIVAYFVLTLAMRSGFEFLPGAVLTTALACTALTLVFGYAGTWRALGQKPAALLRNE